MISTDTDQLIKTTLQPFSPRLVVVFGSMARGEATASSDLDIGVMLESPLTVEQRQAMIKALAGALGRPVDLVDLNRVGEPLLGRILKEGRRLLGAPTHMATLLSRHLANVEDFIPLQKHIMDTRRRAWMTKR
ncbi:MAG TPA: DNA polymerase III subunit beta [Alcanivorax sp.]|nr:DNA polymerase III subunit beta [Alcanivorax sp.]